MSKSLSKQLGFILANIQDLFDTLIHRLLKSSDSNKDNKMINKIKEAGDSYYKTYSDIKKGNDSV